MNKKHPLFLYSLNFKVFIFSGIVLAFSLLATGVAIRLKYEDVSIFWILLIFLSVFGISLFLFYEYVTNPLSKISKEILALLTGKQYKNIPPIRNDEIGVITHFFNTVTDKIKGLSEDLTKGKRMSTELEFAAKIQTDVLPKKAPSNIIGLSIIAKTRSSSEIGGDCFDFLEQGDDTLIYIGDVTGHGVPASLIMMIVNTIIKTLVKENISPKEILAKTNEILKEQISSAHFMSLTMLRWKNMQQKMSFIGAGHEYILHYSQKYKKVNQIKSGGIALKMISNISKILKEVEIDFHEGDTLLLYTDGITEAKGPNGEMYGIERLSASFAQNAYRKSFYIFDKITEDFSKFLGPNHNQEDDITMIVIKNIGQHVESEKVTLSINTASESIKSSSETWDWE